MRLDPKVVIMIANARNHSDVAMPGNTRPASLDLAAAPCASGLTSKPPVIARRGAKTFAILMSNLLYQIAGCGESLALNVAQHTPPAVPVMASESAAVPQNSAVADFKAFALNALLLPLLDDEVPARWADPSLSVDCDDARVTVDGGRPDVGAPVSQSFKVHWHMENCTPLGADLALSGDVELRVESGEHGYTARVEPVSLKVGFPGGVKTLNEPFLANLAVAVE